MSTAEHSRGRATPAWSSARRVFVSFFLGVLLLQTAWILILPAFGGMDEFDHAFKAASVARGHVRAGAPTEGGRGGQVVAPEHLVDAASAMCASYPYTGHDNCYPVRHLGHGNVTVDSGAAAYNPVYYAVVGTISRPFHGANVDFVARLGTAVLTALLLAWAAVVTRRRSSSTWPFLALALVVTPTLIYSSAVTSPNGVGYAAGVLVWSAAASFRTDDTSPPIAAFVTGCLALLVCHSTGVVWLAVIGIAVLAMRPRAAWIEWISRHRRSASWAGGVVVLAALSCVGWILTQKTNGILADDSVARHMWPTVPALIGQWVVWCFQTVGAFPIRDDPAPLIVYPMWLAPCVALMIMGWRVAAPRVKVAMVLTGLAWLLLPTAATIRSYAALGFAWQGRYAMPLSVGLPILAAMALAASGRRPGRRTVLVVMGLVTAAQALCVSSVAMKGQRARFAPTLIPGTEGAVVACVLALLGGVVISLAVTGLRRAAAQPQAGMTMAAVPPMMEPAASAPPESAAVTLVGPLAR